MGYARSGLVGAQFWSVYSPSSSLPGHEAVTATLEQIDFVHQLIARLPSHLELAVTADDIYRVFAAAGSATDEPSVGGLTGFGREVVGIEHVGIGGDYDGVDVLPDGLEDVSSCPRLFAALLTRGWSETDCARVAGGNALRARDVEDVSSRLRKERTPSVARIEAAPRPHGGLSETYLWGRRNWPSMTHG